MNDIIDPNDIAVEYEQRKPGMQPNQVLGGIKLTHKPTGISAWCNAERSQMRNKAVCMEMLEAALTSPKFRL